MPSNRFGSPEQAAAAREKRSKKADARIRTALDMVMAGKSWDEAATVGYPSGKACKAAVKRYCKIKGLMMPSGEIGGSYKRLNDQDWAVIYKALKVASANAIISGAEDIYSPVLKKI